MSIFKILFFTFSILVSIAASNNNCWNKCNDKRKFAEKYFDLNKHQHEELFECAKCLLSSHFDTS
jgi:hypothetical protein